jgi:hypothetical protein
VIRVLRIPFTLSVCLLLLGGTVLVLSQVVALVLGRGDWLSGVADVVGPPTYVSASLAGLFAFAMSYARQGSATESVEEDDPAFSARSSEAA